MKKSLFTLLVGVALFGSVNTATASPFILELSTVVTGATPGGITPYLSLEFEDLGGGSVEVTFNASNLVLSEFATKWYFNLNPTLNPDALSIAYTSGVVGEHDTEANGFSAAGGSDDYDIYFAFPTANPDVQLGLDGDFAVYTFTLAGLTASAFNFNNAADTNGPNFYSMAHIQGVGRNAGLSSWVGAIDKFDEDLEDPPSPAPEPASFALLGVGGLMLIARRYFARK
jgi:hypothetical protein